MSIEIPDSDGEVVEIHTAERLESYLLLAGEKIEEMELNILFVIETRLSNGKIVGQPYLDINNPLKLNCKNNPELAEAMRVIQQAIGEGRYKQLTTPKEVVEPPQSIIPM